MESEQPSTFAEVPIEKVADFWNRRPCNIRHSPKPVGTKEYFDEVEFRKYKVETHIPQFAEFARWRGKRVLEVGCGIGTDTMNFARHGALLTAVDLSEESLKVARQRAEVFGLSDRINFIHANAESLQEFVRVERYDLVYSFGVIHHTPRPDRAIEQFKAYLEPGVSELRLMVYSRVSYKLFWIMHSRNEWDLGRIDELVARDSEAQTGCPVTYTYTPESVRKLLSGFDVQDIRKAHIFTWDFEKLKNQEYVKDPSWAKVSDRELEELESELGWHMLVRANLAKDRV